MFGIGSKLNNRYHLDKKIGEGGFANVFLATDMELGRQVAVKILDQNWLKDKELLTRFRNEARAVAALDHPHILQIYDFGVAKGAPYLVMPYVSGGTLAARMKEDQLTLDEIGVYLDQISSALDYAHQHGIVHRDVKPSNLLIRPNGQLVLMDFGLAKLLNNVFLPEQTAIVGTAAYMAPEQFQGLVSAASDIYVLGVILYQMLSGKLPFEGNTIQILKGHVHLVPGSLKDQPTMQALSPAVIEALDKVIMKVLAKRPADRYSTCQALCYAYREALKAGSKRAGPSSVSLAPSVAPVDPDATQLGPLNISSTPLPQATPLVDADATQLTLEPSPPEKRLLKPPRLLVTTEPDNVFQATFDLTGETLTLGRATDNNICLPLSIISRYHALFSRINNSSQEPSYKIIQRKSLNALLFQGKEVQEKVLENGDTIEIGKRGYAEYVVKLTYQA